MYSYFAHACTNWGFYTLMSYFPSYLKDVYDISVSTASLMILFPYLFFGAIQISMGPISDFLIKKGFKVVTVRKSFLFFGNILTAVFMVIASYCNTLPLAVVFMTLSVGISGCAPACMNANMLDISTKYSGVVMGISNTIATLHIFF